MKNRKYRWLAMFAVIAMLAAMWSIVPVSAGTAPTVTEWKEGDALPSGTNLIAAATKDTDMSSNANPNWTACMTDLTDGTTDNKGIFYAYHPESGYPEAKDPTGTAIKGTTGWVQLTFALADYFAVDKVMLLGSPKDGNANTWSYAGEDAAKSNWGENYTLSGGRYYAAYAPGGEIRKFDDKHLLYYEVYISPTLGNLYDDENLAVAYDNTATLYQGTIHTLATPVCGSYVGIRVTAGSTYQVRIGELGVYGTVAQKPASNIVEWKAGDAIPQDTNWIATADKDTSLSSNANPNWTAAMTALADKDGESKGVFYAKTYAPGYTEAVNPKTGKPVKGTTGWAQLTFALSEYVEVQKVLLVGSPKDGAANTWSYAGEDAAKTNWGENYTLSGGRYHAAYAPGGEIRKFDDKHLLYYEVYISDTLGGLYKEQSRVLSYNNTGTLYQGAMHTLETPVCGSYVGIRVTTGSTYQARIGELGVYGDIAQRPYTGMTEWRDGETFDTDNNLLKNATYISSNDAGEQISSNRLLATTPEALFDGKAADKGTFYTWAPEPGYPDAVNPKTGATLTGTTGWAQFVFGLSGYVSVNKVLLIGSSGDKIDGVWDWATETGAISAVGQGNYILNQSTGRYVAAKDGNIRYFDNKHLQYYEVYVSDTLDALFDKENLALSYDNTDTLYAGAYHDMDAVGAYIGFRVTTGGQSQARIGEIAVYGEVCEKNVTVTGDSPVGTVSVTVESAGSKDRDVLANLLGSVRVTEEALPAGLPKNIDGNWLAVDGEHVYRVEILDKSGNLLAPTGDPVTTLAGRAVQVVFPTPASYMQILGRVENGTVTRIMNAYERADGYTVAGTLNYPNYGEAVINNRQKAVISATDMRFVYLRMNDIATVNALGGQVSNVPLDEFTPAATAGVSRQNGIPAWAIITAVGALLLIGGAAVLMLRRKTVKAVATAGKPHRHAARVFLCLVLCIAMLAAPVSAARYVWEDGILPDGWEAARITDTAQINATDILSPINPNASREAKNLYAYLSSLGDSPTFLSGQFDINTTDDVYQQVKKEFGVEPALYSVRYTVDSSDPTFGMQGEITNSSMSFDSNEARDVKKVNALIKQHYDNGNVLLVHADSAIYAAGGKLAEKKGLTVPGTDYADAVIQIDKSNPDRDPQVYAMWKVYMDNLIKALTELENSGVKAYMFRPWIEFNYNNFNGVSAAGKAAFVRVWQQTVQMFEDNGLTGYLMTYSPGCTVDTIDRYPGNDYVDVLAATIYSDKEKLGTLAGDYFKQYGWYKKTGKPMGFSEISCRTGNAKIAPTQARASWYTLLHDVVANWPEISWVNGWGAHSYSLVNGDGGSLGNDDGGLFLRSPYTLTLDEIVDYRQGERQAPGVVQLFTGKDTYVGLEERTYTAADLQKAGIDLHKLCALRVNSGFAVTFYENDDATGNYWGYGASADAIGAATAARFRSCRVTRLNNVALDVWDVFASTNDYDAYKVNDGSASLWKARTDDPDNTADPGTAWLMIDLGTPCTVSRYAVKHAGYAEQMAMFNTADFRLEYSDNGEKWSVADTVTGNTAGQTERPIVPVTAQHFRLVITKPNNSTISGEETQMMIAEWELFGLDAGKNGPSVLPEEEGLYKIDGVWVYVKDGAIQKDYTGFAKHRESNTWFYVTDGELDWNLSGAFKHPSGIWFVVKNGQIDWSFNGFYKANGVWFYFTNGQIVWETTGLFKHPSGQWFYVKNAQIDWGYTGFGKHLASNTWFYCENGSIAWSKSGAFKHPSGIWFIVNGGQIDWGYNGFYKVQGIWFYFENGQINWNLTGLYKLPSANAWFYVRNAQIDWSYNGKAVKNGVTFNVRNGQVIF